METKYRYWLATAAAIFITIISLNSYSSAQGKTSQSVIISAAEYGDKWPFTVPKGLLACSGADEVTFTVGRDVYAVNGLAMSNKRYKNIRAIWKDDIESEHAKYMIKQGRRDLIPKISTGPIIDRGLKLCK